MSVTVLVLLIVGGSVVLFGGIVFAVFALVKRGMVKAHAALEHEGIVLDSGSQWVKTRYRQFKSPGVSKGGAIEVTRGHLVLTRDRLIVLRLGQRYGKFARADLDRFTVRGDGGTLHLQSDNPPGASGSIEYSVPVGDPAPWLKALIDAGAKPGG